MTRVIQTVEEFAYLVAAHGQGEADPRDIEATGELWTRVITQRPELRIVVARNRTIPRSVVERLAADKDASVRDAIARRRATPWQVLERLAKDADSGVRLAVAYNTSAPRRVLEILSRDTWHEVAAKAEGRLREGSFSD